MTDLSFRYHEFFERARSKRNFIAALFFGIISGGIINLLTAYFSSYISNTMLSDYLPWILLLLSVLLFYLALVFLSRSEKMPTVYKVVIAPENVSSICQTLISEIEKESSKEIVELRRHVEELRKFFGDIAALKSAGIDALRVHPRKILNEIKFPMSHTVSSLLGKLGDYVETIEQMQNYLVRQAQEASAIFEDDNHTIKPHRHGFTVEKERRLLLNNPVLDVRIEANVQHSVLSPAFCIVTIFPQDFQSYRYVQKNLEHFLNRLRWYEKSMQLGIRFIPVEEAEFWERIHDEIAQQFDRGKREIVRELQDFEKGLSERIERLVETKSEKEKDARAT